MIRRLAFLNCFLVLSLVAVSVVLNVLSLLEGSSISVLGPQLFIGPSIAFLPFLAYLIITRRPENIIGPGFSAVASIAALAGVVEAYLHYGLDAAPGSLPGIEFAAWLSEWTFVPAVLPLLTFLFLLCPDGRLPSPRWRPVALFIAGNLVILTLALMVAPFESRPQLSNPFRVTVLGDVPQIAVYVGYVGLIPSIGLSALAMVLRFRRSSGIERLQLKWFASASIAALGLFVLSWIISSFTSSDVIWSYCLLGAVTLVVLATTIAVLRYHLYDIDRIISRTLTYGLLTAALGATYLGLVVGLQALLRPVSGGSDLATVVTTLVVAALFLPARRRIQDAVDRRFNRHAYDAARTIEAFSARLRDQIDLDTLRYELLAVVDETMQPARTSLWLRPAQENGR